MVDRNEIREKLALLHRLKKLGVKSFEGFDVRVEFFDDMPMYAAEPAADDSDSLYADRE